MQTLNIGHNGTVLVNRVMTILEPNSAPVKAMRRQAREQGKFIDATYGRPTRSLLILTDGWVMASSVSPDALNRRLTGLGHEPGQGDPPDQYQ